VSPRAAAKAATSRSVAAPKPPGPPKRKTRVRYDVSRTPLFDREAFVRALLEPKAKPAKRGGAAAGRSPSKAGAEAAPSASVLFSPRSREEWDDSLPELAALCSHAALRCSVLHGLPVHPPLSKVYVRDRLDIDEPLRGYQVRCRGTGGLQGFITFTNYTTWTSFYLWDSLHGESEAGLATRWDSGNR
jgi:hypothetical protein